MTQGIKPASYYSSKYSSCNKELDICESEANESYNSSKEDSNYIANYIKKRYDSNLETGHLWCEDRFPDNEELQNKCKAEDQATYDEYYNNRFLPELKVIEREKSDKMGECTSQYNYCKDK